MAYFPNLLGKDPKKYAHLASWLVAKYGIVNHALRDTFSAGGQVSIKGILFPKIFHHITHDLDSIFTIIKDIPDDDIMHYWKVPQIEGNQIEIWKKQCLKHCKAGLSQKQFNAIKIVLTAT